VTRAKPKPKAPPKRAARPAKRAAKPAKRAAKPAKPASSPPGKAPSLDPVLSAKQLARVREICSALPGALERESHGSPSFFVDGKRAFASFCDNHHHDGRLALWCAAPDGAQAMLVDANPDAYFVPPYVGHQGWVGVRLDRDLPRPEIAAVLEAAHATRTTARRRRR
jgi:hypothetical protein